MKIFLTGASGFVGSYVLQALLDEGHDVRCLVHSRAIESDDSRVESVKGSILDPVGLEGRMAGCEAVVHLVGIIEERPDKGITFESVHDEGTLHVVQGAVRSGITRFIHMSANGARADGVSRYQTTKWAAENHVRQAGFSHWTIFRPSTLFGDPGPGRPEFALDLTLKLIKPFPILPVFGDGAYAMQPLHIAQLAKAMARSITLPEAHGRSYGAGGREVIAYVEILDRITIGLGIRVKPKIHAPLWIVRPVVHTAGRWGLLPISPDQFEMLVEGNTVDAEPFLRDFGIDPIPFEPEHLEYVRQYA